MFFFVGEGEVTKFKGLFLLLPLIAMFSSLLSLLKGMFSFSEGHVMKPKKSPGILAQCFFVD